MTDSVVEPARFADRPSKKHSIPTWAFALGVAATLLWVGFAVVSTTHATLPAIPSLLGHSSGSSGSSGVTVHLYLTISFNPATGQDEYFPANFTVPAHVPVVITITNFDNGTNPVPMVYQQVIGARGGTESVVLAGGNGVPVAMSSIPADRLTHTLTVQTMGGGGSMMAGGSMGPALNLPVPQASVVDGSPSTVSATVVFDTPGHFTWICMAPCDPTAMGRMGFMGGTLTVQ